jgi:Domain of unknown function (DUF1707)
MTRITRARRGRRPAGSRSLCPVGRPTRPGVPRARHARCGWQVFGLAGIAPAWRVLMAAASRAARPSADPAAHVRAARTAFVPAHRCGAVPDTHWVPSFPRNLAGSGTSCENTICRGRAGSKHHMSCRRVAGVCGRSRRTGPLRAVPGRGWLRSNAAAALRFQHPAGGVVSVTTRPGDHGAADPVSRGLLRASHADREHVVEVLKAAFVLGMLTKAELDVRAGEAFVSRTYRDLAAITADLPAGVIGARQPRARPGGDRLSRTGATGEQAAPVDRGGDPAARDGRHTRCVPGAKCASDGRRCAGHSDCRTATPPISGGGWAGSRR